MRLDVLTPKGQESVMHERRAIELFHARFDSYRLKPTPKSQPADCDGMVFRSGGDGEICAIVETKCRDMSRATFENKFGSLWLITADKLSRCRRLGTSLRVPFIGLLYLIPDDLLFVQRIYNADGSAATEIETRSTETQETCNGGRITRLNAYVLVQREAAPQRTPQAPQQEAKPISQADLTEWLAEYNRFEAVYA